MVLPTSEGGRNAQRPEDYTQSVPDQTIRQVNAAWLAAVIGDRQRSSSGGNAMATSGIHWGEYEASRTSAGVRGGSSPTEVDVWWALPLSLAHGVPAASVGHGDDREGQHQD